MSVMLVESCQIVPAFMPVNMAAGDNTGDFVDMSHFNRLAIVFIASAGASGQDPTVTVLQAQTNGGSAKALDFTRVDVKQGTALSAIGAFTTVTKSVASNTYTSTGSGGLQKLWVIDIRASDLDRNNGYRWVQASVADTGSTSQIGAMLYILYEPRYIPALDVSAI